VDGVLVEKPMGFYESILAAVLIEHLRVFVKARDLGVVISPDGNMRLERGLVRSPDIGFLSWSRFPGRKIPRGATDAPPVALFVGEPTFLGSPDEIEIRLKVRNEDEGQLEALVEVLKEPEPGGAPIPVAEAVPFPGSELTRDIPNDVEVTFHWDVKANLGDDSALVRIVITPIEDGRKGKKEASLPFRAGNTPAELRELEVSSNREVLRVGFTLVDKEEDRVRVEPGLFDVEVEVEDGGYEPLPLGYVERRDFPGAPEPGAQGSFRFNITALASDPALAASPLRALGEPGFFGSISVRVKARDFAGEDWSTEEVRSFPLDNNSEPEVEILSLGAADPANRVFPIRCRAFDPELNTADLIVEVDLGDGAGFRTANELPLPPSSGRTGLCTQNAADPLRNGCGNAGDGAVHTFLWDALSQLPFRPPEGLRPRVQVRARDRELGPPFERVLDPIVTVAGLQVKATLRVKENPFSAASGDFNGDGIADLAVANRNPSGGGTEHVTLLKGSPSGLTAPGNEDSIPVGRRPFAVVTADFDNDPFDDVITANDGSNDLTFVQGAPAGLGAPAAAILLEGKPLAILREDFDRDGSMDVAVSHEIAGGETDSVTVLYGRLLDHTAEHGRRQRIGVGREPRLLASGDLDGNGLPDLVVSNQLSKTLSLLLGSQTGLPARPEDMALGAGESVAAITVWDSNGDGRLEVAVADPGRNEVTVFQVEDGKLEEVASGTSGGNPTKLATGDLNGDGRIDLVAVSANTGEVSIYPGSPGVLPRELAPVSLPGGALSGSPTPGDFDGDGFTDLAFTNFFASRVSYMRGSPQWLIPTGTVPVGGNPEPLVAADFDGDGVPDVASINKESDDVTYLRGTAGGLAANGGFETGRKRWDVLSSGDHNGDGFLDLVAGTTNFPSVVFVGGSPQGLTAGVEHEVGESGRIASLLSADLDGDGFDDAISGLYKSERSGEVVLLRGSASGGLAEPLQRITTPGVASGLARGDLSGDGVPDLAVVMETAGRVWILPGAAGGMLEESRRIEIPASGPRSPVIADVDGDGILDLAVANGTSAAVLFVPGAEIRGEAPVRGTTIEVAGVSVDLVAGDFDGDGLFDLAAACEFVGQVSFIRGAEVRAAQGASAARKDIAVEGNPSIITPGDFDGDGFTDLAAVGRGTSSVAYIRGGPRGLEQSTLVPAEADPTTTAAGDLDGDGLLDLAVAGSGSTFVRVLRGSDRGLLPGEAIPLGVAAFALTSGDFDGDGFTDVLASADKLNPRIITLRQLYLRPHVSSILGPGGEGALPADLVEPQSPPAYRLELGVGAFSGSTQVCLIAAPFLALPQADWFVAGKHLVNVTRPVSLLLAGVPPADDAAPRRGGPGPVEILGGGRLTLRLRDLDEPVRSAVLDESPTLRVFRGSLERGGAWELLEELEGTPSVGDFPPGKGITITVKAAGAYTVAIELDRPGNP
jgi:hypothetical protein